MVSFLAVLLLLAPVAAADVRLPRIFGDHMVLQSGRELPVWGWAAAGEKVTVAVAGKTAEATAGGNGKWKATLPALKPGGPFEMTVKGKNTITFKDVVVGEVWLCSGQSNMDVPVGPGAKWWKGVLDCKEELAKANKPNVRVFQVAYTWKRAPIEDVNGKWVVSTPEVAAKFPATAYFFASHLHQELQRPVGVIVAAMGGMPIEQFTPNSGQAFWYNGMIAPVIPYGITGATWYQGETNLWVGDGMNYFAKQKTLVERWRKNWGQGDFSFYLVQIAPLGYGDDAQRLARFWEAQAKTLSMPNTGIASTMDIGDIKDVHPRNKRGVGERLALWALAKDYGRDVVCSGPLYKSMKIVRDTVRVSYDYVGSGLESRDGKPLTWFEIAGEGAEGFVPAKAVIRGKTVVVSSEKITRPTAVRFAWNHLAQPNLQNKDGLPAFPFRSCSTAPTFAGRPLFVDATSVQLACKESNGVIRYTRNGATPTKRSPKYTKPIRITETTTVRARFFRTGGPASVVVSATYTKGKPRKHDGLTLVPGVRYDYYEGQWNAVPDFAALKPKKSGVAEGFSIAPRDRNDDFGFRFTGYLEIKTAGKYTFQTASDDGSKLSVNGKEIVNNDGVHGVVAKAGAIDLEPGMHKIVVTFFERAGGEGLFVKYKGPGISMQELPCWGER